MDFETLSRFERINVVGTSGSGKTTFARELAKALDLPFYEMDQMFWQADWQPASDEELTREVREVTSQPKWVVDGNYTRTIPDKWKQVELVIWLDLSFARTVLRVTKRTIRRAFTQQELWPGTGNRESLATSFLSRDSVIWWAITTYRNNRSKYRDLMASPAYSHIRFVRLSSPRSVAAYLAGVRDAFEQSQHESGRPGSLGIDAP